MKASGRLATDAAPSSMLALSGRTTDSCEMKPCMAIWALALQAYGCSKQVHLRVFVCVSFSHTHTLRYMVPKLPVHHTILFSWSYSHRNVEQKSSQLKFCCHHSFPWDAVGSSPNRDATAVATYARDKCVSSWYGKPSRMPNTSSLYFYPLHDIPTHPPGKRTGRHHLWLHDALIVAQLSSWSLLVIAYSGKKSMWTLN